MGNCMDPLYDMFKIEVLLPEDFVDTMIEKLQDAGIGKNGHYDSCFTIIPVINRYRRLEGSDDFLGSKIGELVKKNEVKLEFRVKAHHFGVALTTIQKNHPFENPIINTFPLI